MQRKIITLLLAVTMLIGTIAVPVKPAEAASSTNNAGKVIDALEIMDTDQGNSTNPAAKVTRAQYAQMLVNMSALKDQTSAKSNVSLFKDVTKKYWAAGYIQTAINQGWMSGYMNGTFKPSQSITLMEAVNGVLKLLGYTNSDFTGNLNAAEMALYESKDLDKNITKTQKQALTRKDCMNLFYNTLIAKTKDGKIYAETLGYTVDSKGEMDYLSLVNTKMEGPILVDNDWKSQIPFFLGEATFYKDGTLGTLNDIQQNDVVYYSKNLKSVWAYDNKVTGSIQTILPNRLAPTSVKLGGKEYSLGSNDMSVAFSSLGKVDEGDVVTLILGKDDTVVDVLGIDEYNVTVTGIVVDNGERVMTNDKDELVSSNYVAFVDAGGNKYEQDYDLTAITFSEGEVVRVTYDNGIASVNSYKAGSTSFGSNTFSSDGMKLGSYKLASNVKILDYYKGSYKSIKPSRLANITLGDASVNYYELNSSGDISKLILNNVTGDVYKYGILTGISSQGSDKMSFDYNINGTTGTGIGDEYDVKEGPKGFIFDDDDSTQIEDLIDLTKVNVRAIGASIVQDSTQKYMIADEVAVFFHDAGKYSVATLSDVSNLNKYKLTAYYDGSMASGGRIRVIIAENIK
ncbi:S-layer homology domain-containing protein [Anaerocolumna sp. MB42-C2]|uniref:S-layer homology domain-containing protein n=1 Tax=Anaerocolumna sp. MB42-C2 TaxID=3070997 RepID=UPI0027E1DC41|nr:S-layer homology domain-containing protein [Anaerocolumna sp. MB42-C2]WMJ88100.1 S-layer homology domain-containing protein [Anaerocolumna sp. MB42-C2]